MTLQWYLAAHFLAQLLQGHSGKGCASREQSKVLIWMAALSRAQLHISFQIYRIESVKHDPEKKTDIRRRNKDLDSKPDVFEATKV